MAPRISKKTLAFITKASKQKDPAWLDRNRALYEETLVFPLRELMTEVARILKPEAPGYRFPTRTSPRIRRTADRAKAQGWFKNWVGLSASRDSGSMYEDFPSLYFHLSATDVFTAGGLYMPSARQTKQIRAWIDHGPDALEKLLDDREFKRMFRKLGDERVLKTKPRDYPIDHPRIDWLKMTGWYVWKPIPKKELFSRAFPTKLAEQWHQILRLNRVLDHYTRSWPSENRKDSGILKLDPDLRAPEVNWNSD